MPNHRPPLNVAAIDAGSNALRLLICRVESPMDVRLLENRRYAVRLGHRVFTQGELDQRTIAKATEAFQYFSSLMDRYEVKEYRAVATSACREARNREELENSIYEASGIRLDVIDAAEEARLINLAVMEATGDDFSADLITDLGGGSLEVTFIQEGTLVEPLSFPIGTVRIMENFDLYGSFKEKDLEAVRAYILGTLESSFSRQRPDINAVACGGNAEFLAGLAPGKPRGRIKTLDIYLLEELLWRIIELDVPQRMKKFGARQDRAEVMGIAAVVFTTLARLMHLDSFVVPEVGVKEGTLRDLVTQVVGEVHRSQENRARGRLNTVRRLAARLNSDRQHSEHVRLLSLMLFEQTKSRHGLGNDMRHLLELAAVLHDIGYAINRKQHHKHGEYLVLNADIAGLTVEVRQMLACLIRYHTKGEPKTKHPVYGAMDAESRRKIRILASFLRLAEAMDSDHLQNVSAVKASFSDGQVEFNLIGGFSSDSNFVKTKKMVRLLEKEFNVSASFRVEATRAETLDSVVS